MAKTYRTVAALIAAANANEVVLFGTPVKGDNTGNTKTFAIYRSTPTAAPVAVRVNRKGEKTAAISVPGILDDNTGRDKRYKVSITQLSGFETLGVQGGVGGAGDLEADLAAALAGDDESVE